jgi:hypothetical protein
VWTPQLAGSRSGGVLVVVGSGAVVLSEDNLFADGWNVKRLERVEEWCVYLGGIKDPVYDELSLLLDGSVADASPDLVVWKEWLVEVLLERRDAKDTELLLRDVRFKVVPVLSWEGDADADFGKGDCNNGEGVRGAVVVLVPVMLSSLVVVVLVLLLRLLWLRRL